jgi:hypothetical protein
MTMAVEWLRSYAQLALRLNRHITATAGGTVLIYGGPDEWRAAVEQEDPPPSGRLVDDAERLLDDVPFEPRRAAYLVAHVHAFRAVARSLNGERLALREYARQCLGVEADWVPESRFDEAHARLDAALPHSTASLADRLRAWQVAHSLPPQQMAQLPGLVDKAVAETRARTSAIVSLPVDEVVECQLVPDAHFLAAGLYHGHLRSTIYVNGSVPFNLADLLYVVAHEGHPGHIAESLLKEIHLVDGDGRLEQQVRFLLTPSFVISEGLGLHAEAMIFPDDQAQAWLSDNILSHRGVRPDGSDFAGIHHAKNVLWGAWSNTAFLAADGRPAAEIAAYLRRWALLSDDEVGAALKSLEAPGMDIYVVSYYHGWRLLQPWLDGPDRHDRVRRLLTEQLLPADLDGEGGGRGG